MLITIGDSITAGAHASGSVTRYVNILATYAGENLSNYGVNGYCSADAAIQSRTIPFAQSGDIITCMIGVNDSLRYTTVAKQKYYEAFLREIISSALIPSRVKGRDTAMVKTGTWPASQPWWSQGNSSNVAGSEATCTISGETIYVGTILQDLDGGPVLGVAEIYVDGVLVGIISSNGQGMNTSYNAYAPACYRFSGFSLGLHEVKIKLISGWIYLEYIAGSEQDYKPKFYLSTVTKLFQPVSNDTEIISLNAIVRGIANEFAEDGFNVTLVDNYPILAQSDLIDGIHPGDGGMAKLAASFFMAMGGVAMSEVKSFIGSDGKYYIGNGHNKKQVMIKE